MEIIATKPNLKIKTFHIDGMGCRQDGSGSAFGWVRVETGRQRIYSINGLTELQAEYKALFGVLKYVAPGSRATIFTHSHELWRHFNIRFRARGDRELAKLYTKVRQMIQEKELKIRVGFILREDNRAVIVPDYSRRKMRGKRLAKP
jgi:hypothetical protein